ncbi:MAG TPA: cysteine desulfurase [Blastocatellia bacterium]|nr:cysteine desulfurase [Blastocatellia bacterium]
MSTRGEALTPKENRGAAHAPQPELFDQIVSASAAPEVVQLVHASKNIGASSLDVRRIREDFPILKQGIRGKPLVYLDNAASTQKPKMVIDAICHTYLTEYSNIHRGVHLLSELCTKAYEDTRVVLQHFVNAGLSREIIFVRGATEGINLVAQSYGRKHVGAGDEIVISAMEHHSNIVPWQMLCEEKGAHLRVIPMNDEGELLLDEYEKLLTDRTRIVGIGHVSNALGTINPVKQMIRMAHDKGIPVLIDGAQAVPHLKVDVRELDADFYVFSGHKIYGPSGIGILYGKADLLEKMPPYQGGGDMISSVTFEKTTYNVLPYKFEAGTPNIGGTIGLGAAIDYVKHIGLDNIAAYEHDLLTHGTELLNEIPGVRIIGTAKEKAAVISFVIEGIHPHDVGTILDQDGIAVRTGHHCAQPVMDRFGVPATARASFAFYNTREEIDALAAGIWKVKEVFA